MARPRARGGATGTDGAPGRQSIELPADLRLGDLETFVAVRRYGSLTGAARDRGVTTSQVSKAVARLEQLLHLSLLSRSVRGVLLTDEALRILPDLEQAIVHFQRMMRAESGPEKRSLAIAAPSYLLGIFLPVIAECLPHLRLRGLELPPSLLRARATENLFDAGLLPGPGRLPATWESVPVGALRMVLLARPALARRLGKPPVNVERLRELPFITPVYFSGGRYIPVDDDCPLSVFERRPGHSVQTITLALQLAVHTDQLVYGLLIAAHQIIAQRGLQVVEVAGWRASVELHFAFNAQEILTGELRAIVAALRRTLVELS